MKVRIQATQLIEVPDSAEIVDGPGGQLLKIGGIYYNPDIEFTISGKFDSKSMSFQELDEETSDVLLGLKEEIVKIEQEL